MKLDNYPFNGWDYTELAEAWNLYIPVWPMDDKLIEYYLEGLFRNYNGNKPTRPMRKAAKDIRLFLTELSKSKISYQSPMWKGMSEIKDDFTLIQMTIPNIGYMWD
jgi:hypothetical protein